MFPYQKVGVKIIIGNITFVKATLKENTGIDHKINV